MEAPNMKRIGVGVLMILLVATAGLGKIGGGDITFEVKKAGNVVFSHDSHVSGAGLRCTDCHDSLFVTIEKHKPVKMAQMQKGESCGACHNGKKAFDVKANCSNCHKK
jgi:c(7)-type cytochrome triheme protein